MVTSQERLADIISNGIVKDIFLAEEAIFLNELIGEEADRINQATFGAFFGSLQVILGRHIILAVNRMFEEGNPRYEIRSIPVAIKLLSDRAVELRIEQKAGLMSELSKLGCDEQNLRGVSDDALTKLAADSFAKRLPQGGITEPSDLSEPLSALKTTRNKIIAHHEAISFSELPKATYGEIEQLIAFGKQFVSTIGWAYLGIAYEAKPRDYFLTTDAGRASRSLRRLLVKAGVLTTISADT